MKSAGATIKKPPGLVPQRKVVQLSNQEDHSKTGTAGNLSQPSSLNGQPRRTLPSLVPQSANKSASKPNPSSSKTKSTHHAKGQPTATVTSSNGNDNGPAKQPNSQVLTPTPNAPTRKFSLVLPGRPQRLHSSDEMLQEGLFHAGVPYKRQDNATKKTNIDRFTTLYGSQPHVYAKIWADLQTTSYDQARIDGCNDSLKGFFIALHFLKRYRTEKESSLIFSCSPTTINKYRWYYITHIRHLKQQKILWPIEWTIGDATIPTLLLSVDGTHFEIEEPQHERYNKNTKFYSKKFGSAGLSYEIGIDLAQSRVVHTRGPYRAAQHDITIFREELKDKIPKGHFCIGDLGYIGEPAKVVFANSYDTPAVRQFKARARSRQETFNNRVKFFEAMSSRFRHGIDQHEECFDCVVVIIQYQMEMGFPLFDV